MNRTASGGSSSSFRRALDASGLSDEASSIMNTLCLPSKGLSMAERCASLTWSIPISLLIVDPEGPAVSPITWTSG